MKNVNKYKNGAFSGDQLDQFTRKLVNAKIGNDKKQKWKRQLEIQHDVKRHSVSVFVNHQGVFLKMLSIAAAITLILLAGYFIVTSRDVSPAQLAQSYLEEPFPNSLVRKGGNDEVELRLKLAEAYNEKNYLEAIALGKQLSTQNKMQASDHFFLGLSYLYQNNNESAIVEFLNVRKGNTRTTDFRQEANWFLALAYLKADKSEDAKRELKSIMEKKEWEFEKAKEILKKME